VPLFWSTWEYKSPQCRYVPEFNSCRRHSSPPC